jgi:hypothetical protein
MEEFLPAYRVPAAIEQLVALGVLEDLSWRNDRSPSFGTRLRDRTWLRLWVEHPNPGARTRGTRFTVAIQQDPASGEGEVVARTERVEEALFHVSEIVDTRGIPPKLRLLGFYKRNGYRNGYGHPNMHSNGGNGR